MIKTYKSKTFNLKETTLIKRNRSCMSRQKKVWQKLELQKMLDANIIPSFTSSFASPVTIVQNGESSFRFTTNHRLMNQQTDVMTRIETIIDNTCGCTMFTPLYLCKGFWQVPLDEEYKECLSNPFDVYEYNRRLFGWKNSRAWFKKKL